MRGKHDREEAGVPASEPHRPGREQGPRRAGTEDGGPPPGGARGSAALASADNRGRTCGSVARRRPQRRSPGGAGRPPPPAELSRTPTAPPPESLGELGRQPLRLCRGSGHTELRAASPGAAGSPAPRGRGCTEAPHLSRPAPPPTRSRRRLHVRSVVLNLAPLSPPRPLRGGRSRGYPEEGSRPGSWAAGSSVPSSTLMAHGLQVTGGGVGSFSGHTPLASGCPGHFPVCNGNHWTTWERDGTWVSFTTPLSIARGYAARVTSTGTWA